MDTRLERLKALLAEQRIDAVLISSVPNITYLTGYANFSLEEREAYLLITRKEQYILTDGRYTTAIRKQVKNFTLFEISSTNPFKKAMQKLAEKHDIKTLGIEEKNITVAEYKILQPMFNTLQAFPSNQLKLVKDTNEIAAIEKACALGDQAFNFIINKIRLTMTEKELAWELEKYIREQGAELSFRTIIAFGPHAAIPHHQTSEQKLTPNNYVLIDFGVKVDNYCSDMTRTVFFGRASDEQKRIYQTVHDAQQKAIDFLNSQCSIPNMEEKPIHASDVDKAARDYITSQGYPSIPHSLGHGIGLEVHEPPTLSPISKQTLEAGMVFSIEPGIYIPDFGGVRIEDLFVIEKDELRQLTNAPNKFIEL